MSSQDTPELFPEPNKAQDVDAKVWAESVAAAGDRRGPVEERPPSEAAIDQGWGPVEKQLHPIHKTETRKQKPFRGIPRGESGFEGDHKPAGHDDYEPLDDEVKEIGKRALAEMRKKGLKS